MVNSLVSGVEAPYCSVVPYSTYPCTTSSELTSISALVSMILVTEMSEMEGPDIGGGVVSVAGGEVSEVSVVVSAGRVWASIKGAFAIKSATTGNNRSDFFTKVLR